jgi:hypothetical protein
MLTLPIKCDRSYRTRTGYGRARTLPRSDPGSHKVARRAHSQRRSASAGGVAKDRIARLAVRSVTRSGYASRPFASGSAALTRCKDLRNTKTPNVRFANMDGRFADANRRFGVTRADDGTSGLRAGLPVRTITSTTSRRIRPGTSGWGLTRGMRSSVQICGLSDG